MDQELIAFLDERFRESAQHTTQQITQHIAALRQETLERFEKVESSIHHTQIMLEDLRDTTQLLAEGLSGVEEKLQSFREEVNERFDQAQKTTTLYYSDLDRRLRVVEQRTEKEGPRI